MIRMNKNYYYYFHPAMLDFECEAFEPRPLQFIGSGGGFPVKPFVNPPIIIKESDNDKYLYEDKELKYEDEVNLDLCDLFFIVAIKHSPLRDVIGLAGYAEIKTLIKDLMDLMSESNFEDESANDRLSGIFPFIEENFVEKFTGFKSAFCTRVAADSKSSDKEVWEFVLPYHNQMISKKDLIYSAALAKFDQK